MINPSLVNHTLQTLNLLSPEELLAVEPVCSSVCSEMTKRVRSEKDETNPAVINACAYLTFYRFTLLRGLSQEEFTSFKAGDITVSQNRNARLENAVKLRDEALLSASPYLKDIDFVFRTVT